MKIFLNFIVIPIMIAVEVVGISKFYPRCEDSFWKMFILYLGVYFAHDIYKIIKNNYQI